MITGIGTDIVEVERIRKALEKERGFRELVFAPEEITYCEAQTNKFQHYAARFAAKEAFFKALGTGWKDGTAFNEVAVVKDEKGKPGIRLLNKTAATLQHLNPASIFVSLSHISPAATAIVVIEES
ncbi:MAG: holo-ACP synthase [Chitinophagaceae bacterium]|nr:holo-ACP synthase [Chitinophagaceae bacterium]MCW5927356.1 holo-ACP synthase [Chitinophagaceae bacterium]